MDNAAGEVVSFLQCPACPRPLAEHLYADRVLNTEATRQEQYVQDVDETPPTEFARLYPAAQEGARSVLRVLKCPNGGGSVVPLVLAESVLDDDRCVGMTLSLSPEDVARLASALGNAWRPYGASWVGR